jgi:hypothetical protein
MLVRVGAAGLVTLGRRPQRSPSRGDASTADVAGPLIELPPVRGLEEGELTFHGSHCPQGV